MVTLESLIEECTNIRKGIINWFKLPMKPLSFFTIPHGDLKSLKINNYPMPLLSLPSCLIMSIFCIAERSHSMVHLTHRQSLLFKLLIVGDSWVNKIENLL